MLAEVVDGEVHDDPVQPGEEAGVAFKLVQVLVSLDESVLDHVQGVVLVTDHTKRQRVGAPVVPLEQRLERVAIAALRSDNQLAVIDRVTSMRRDGRSLTRLIHAGPSYHGPHSPSAS